MKTIKKIVSVIVGSLFIGSTLLLGGCTTTPIYNGQEIETTEDIQGLVDQAKLAGANSVDITADNTAVANAATELSEAALAQAKIDSDAEEARLQAIIDDYAAVEIEVAATDLVNANAYTLDELELGASFAYNLSDREVDKLFDTTVKFKNTKYDAEEVLRLEGKIGIDDEDYDGSPYLEIEEAEIAYSVLFESELNTSEIDEDDTLEFKFLGEDVEVSDWNDGEITFTSGTVEFLGEGETSADGKVKVDAVGETGDEGYAKITVDGVTDILKVGDTEEINGLEINLREVLLNDEIDQLDYAELKIGTDVETDVEDGDEYEQDDRFEWQISANSIGIVLNEDYVDLDDKYYNALAAGESIILPNDFLTIQFDGIVGIDTESLDITDDNNYDIEIDGNFAQDIENYDRLFINASGIYDEDDESLGTSIDIDNTDSTLELANGNVTIGDIELALDFSDIFDDGDSIEGNDYTYLNSFGIAISDTEDLEEDKDITIVVPEEEVQAEITIK